MTKRSTLIAVAFAVAGVTTLAVSAVRADLRSDFKQSDYDGNGVVSRAEYDKRMTDRFFFLDRNKDGYLSKAEAIDLSPKQFSDVDKDGDGRLTRQEFLAARAKMFSQADLNKNGSLDLSEVEHWSK